MFQTVHAQAGTKHQDQYGKNRGKQLLFLAGNNCCNNIKGIEVGVNLEESDDSDRPEHTKTGALAASIICTRRFRDCIESLFLSSW